MTVAHDLAVTASVDEVRPVVDPLRDLGLHGLDEQIARATVKDRCQRIVRGGRRGRYRGLIGGGWKTKRLGATVRHGGVLLPTWAVEGAVHTPKVRRLIHAPIHRFWSYPTLASSESWQFIKLLRSTSLR